MCNINQSGLGAFSGMGWSRGSSGDTQFVCLGCCAIVVVPSMVVLDPIRKAALAATKCLDCFGPREVKSL